MKANANGYRMVLRTGGVVALLAIAPCVAVSQTTTTAAVATEPATRPATRPVLGPADPAATKVTLHIAGMPRTDAFAALSAASGFGTPAGKPAKNEPLITVDADDQPYWNVFAAVVDQAKGVDLASPAVGLPLAGAAPDALSGTRSLDGAFVLSLNRWERSVQFTGVAAPQRDGSLEATIAYEPRLGVLYLDRIVAPNVAVDENGLTLVPTRDGPQPPRAFNGDYNNPLGRSASTIDAPLSIDINIPRSAGRRVADLQLTVRAWLAQDMRKFKCDYQQEGTDTGGALPCKVSWEGSPDAPQVNVHFERGSIKPETWQNLAAFLSTSRIRVVDDSGVDWRTDADRNNGDYQDDQLTIHRVFNRPPGPNKTQPIAAIIEVPVAVKPVELHFSFKDVPLP